MQLLSSDYTAQKENFQFAVLPDELASDFCETDFQRARILHEHGWITNQQMEMASQIRDYFERMNQDKNLWTDEALKNAPEWEHCRELGKKTPDFIGLLDLTPRFEESSHVSPPHCSKKCCWKLAF